MQARRVDQLTALDVTRLTSVFDDGVATRAALVGLGIAESVVARRCGADGRWRRLLPGVVLLRTGEPSQRQQLRAALLHAGEPAVITGVTAARLHGVVRVPADDRVHVLIPASRQVGSREFVVVRRTIRMPKHVMRAGVPLAPLARCLVDAAARLSSLDEVRAMFADAVQRRLCTVAALAAELGERRRPGTALARAVLVELLDGVRSAAEAWARALVRRTDLPAPEWNVAVHRPDGQLIAVVDGYWREVGLAWGDRLAWLPPRSGRACARGCSSVRAGRERRACDAHSSGAGPQSTAVGDRRAPPYLCAGRTAATPKRHGAPLAAVSPPLV